MRLLNYIQFVNESLNEKNGKDRKEYIDKYCGEFTPLPQKPMSLETISGYLKKLGKYPETLKAISNGDAVIVGIRRKLEVRKKNPEKYIDSIYFIPKNSKEEPKKQITPFQATTVPSVAWYDTKVAILDDGEYRFRKGQHGFSFQTIPALVPSIPGLADKHIKVNRYDIKDDEVKTYDPPKKDDGTATNFHFGLMITPTGMDRSKKNISCVGPFSAGCQVIPTEEKWNEFWKMIVNSKQQFFWYSIIEEDKI